MATVTQQIEDMQQITNTPRRITRSTLTRSNRNDVFIEGLPDVDLSEKCDDFITKKLINIQEANLREASILPVSKNFLIDFANNFKPSAKDEKTLEAETHTRPFPTIKLKSKAVILNFLTCILAHTMSMVS